MKDTVRSRLANLVDTGAIGVYDADRLLEDIRTVLLENVRKDIERLPEINDHGLIERCGVKIDNLDGTGWLCAITPNGRIGNYATYEALLEAIVHDYVMRFNARDWQGG